MKYAVIAASFLLFIDLTKRTGITQKEKVRKNIAKAKSSRIIKILVNPKSKAYEEESRLLQKARVNISVEIFQLIKLATLILTSVIIALSFITHQNIKINEILNKKTIKINIVSNEKNLRKNDAFLNKLTKEAYERIEFKTFIERGDYKKLQKKIYDLVKEKGLDKKQTLDYAEKVYYNILLIYKNRFRLIHLLIIILLSLASVNIPKLILRLRSRKTESLMEVELNKLEILALLLLKKEDINIYQILLKLKSKSDVFRPYLKKCVNNFQKDGRKAMEVMQKEADYKPFTDFINILKQGIDTNKKTTFTVIEMSRRLRNEIYQLMVKEKNRKKNRNILLTRFPILLVLLYLLVLPWLIIFKENFNF